MQLNKTFLTHALAVLLIGLSFVFLELRDALLFGGLFALSGALTNQLAIHMLFERVPFLYGSGVIPLRFAAFTSAIKKLMMEEFFTPAQLENFLNKEEKKINLAPIIEETDFAPAFDALSKTVMESSFGGMLGMFGGERALEGLREPFSLKMKNAVIAIANSDAFNATLSEHLQNSSLTSDMLTTLESLIDERLAELTPQMVKEMVQKLIREHLDWLVVWGGVFGGAIGVLSSLVI